MAIPESETADAGALVNAVLSSASKAAIQRLAALKGRKLMWCGLLDDYSELGTPPNTYARYRVRIILWEERDRLFELSVQTDPVPIGQIVVDAMRAAWRSVFSKPRSAWSITSFSPEIPAD